MDFGIQEVKALFPVANFGCFELSMFLDLPGFCFRKK